MLVAASCLFVWSVCLFCKGCMCAACVIFNNRFITAHVWSTNLFNLFHAILSYIFKINQLVCCLVCVCLVGLYRVSVWPDCRVSVWSDRWLSVWLDRWLSVWLDRGMSVWLDRRLSVRSELMLSIWSVWSDHRLSVWYIWTDRRVSVCLSDCVHLFGTLL